MVYPNRENQISSLTPASPDCPHTGLKPEKAPVAVVALGTGKWVTGLAAAILAIGMGLQGCSSTENTAITKAETQESKIEDLVKIQAFYSNDENEPFGLKYGYINTKGEIVIPPRFEYVGDFAVNGLVAVMENRKSGYINTKGEMVIPPKFEWASNFAANGLAVFRENREWGYINARGEMIIPPRFGWAKDFAANGLAAVRENREWGYINARGEMIIAPRFEWAKDFAANGLAAVRENGKWGYVNAKGEMVIPARFEDIGGFAANGLAAVRENEKWGYINTKGEMVIPARFESTSGFVANGLVAVREKGKWGYINSMGEIETPPSFENPWYYELLDSAAHGLAVVKENGKWGYINAKGKMVIPSKFEEAEPFADNGLAAVKENGKYFYINANGEMAIPQKFEKAVSFSANGLAAVKDSGKWGYINAQGQFIIYIDETDGQKVIKNASGAVIWVADSLYPDQNKIELKEPQLSKFDYTPFARKTSLISPKTPPSLQIDRDYPKLDGAEALIPIYAAAANAIYRKGKNQYDRGGKDPRKKAVRFSEKTPAAYQALINGQADMIFALAPSEEQKKEAAEKGITYTLTPIAREAFVFLVNEQNPVEGLSIGQIRDIYSGKTDNWQEVGGTPGKIMAFQRNKNSGSQTAMLRNVMHETPMRNPLEIEYYSGMGELLYAIANYRNLGKAIGYSFRYYATVMNSVPGIRLLAVDGVAPTVENIRNGSYPFTEDFYIVTTRPLSKNASKLRDWFLSDEGQQFIAQVGYVPIRGNSN